MSILKIIFILGLVTSQVLSRRTIESVESLEDQVDFSVQEEEESNESSLPLKGAGSISYDPTTDGDPDEHLDKIIEGLPPGVSIPGMTFDQLREQWRQFYKQHLGEPLPEPTPQELKKVDKKLNMAELKVTNQLRALHGAKPLEYDPKIAVYAQKYLDSLVNGNYVWDHNPDKTKRLGENMAGSINEEYKGTSTNMWYFREIGTYIDNGEEPSDPPNPTGHFTAVVWAETQKMGCGRACRPHDPTDCQVLCNYYPSGNRYTPGDRAATVANYRKNVNMKMSKSARNKYNSYKKNLPDIIYRSPQGPVIIPDM